MSRVAAGYLPWSFRHKYDHCRAARYSLFVILFHLPKIFSTPQQISTLAGAPFQARKANYLIGVFVCLLKLVEARR